jgi:hypothetical protein
MVKLSNKQCVRSRFLNCKVGLAVLQHQNVPGHSSHKKTLTKHRVAIKYKLDLYPHHRRNNKNKMNK